MRKASGKSAEISVGKGQWEEQRENQDVLVEGVSTICDCFDVCESTDTGELQVWLCCPSLREEVQRV